jgi:hypothetical protein
MLSTAIIIVLSFLLILSHLKRNKLEKERNYWRNIFTNKYVDDDIN